MQLKSVLAFCALALVGANAVDSSQSAQYCYDHKGMYLDSRGFSDDTRFACLLPYKNGDENSKYCVNYGGQHVCYTPKYGNMSVCDLKSKDFHSRGCALGLGYLYDNAYMDDQKHQSSRDYCYKQKGSMFLEGTMSSPTDTRFACLLPYKNGDEKTKNCVVYGGQHVCYTQEYSNMIYCDLKSSYYHGRGCALSLGYLYDAMVAEDNKHNSSRTACKRKNGLFLENTTERWDRRFACLLPERANNNKYCASINGKSGCYAPQYSNMNICDMSTPEFHSRGCALGLGYLSS